MRAALVEDLNQVPFWLRRSLTWDRGREMADYATLTSLTGCRVYFCDPRSPWRRGTNENTNRLLRQYLSKTGELATYDQAALDLIAARVNSRPCEVLGWHTPPEVLAGAPAVLTLSRRGRTCRTEIGPFRRLACARTAGERLRRRCRSTSR